MSSEKEVNQFNFRLNIKKDDLKLTAEAFGVSINKLVENAVKPYIESYQANVAAFNNTMLDYVSERQKKIFNLYRLLYTDKNLFIAVCEENIDDDSFFKMKSLIEEGYEGLYVKLSNFLESIYSVGDIRWEEYKLQDFIDAQMEELAFPPGSKLQIREIGSNGVEIYRLLKDSSILFWGIKDAICNAYRIQKPPLFITK